VNRNLSWLFAVLALAVCAVAQVGKEQATLATRTPKVEQGKSVILAVKVTPAPSVDGALVVEISPDAAPSQVVRSSNGFGRNTETADAAVAIPVDGKLGVWRVIGVQFIPQNSEAAALKTNGNATFEVIERKTVLPKSADVQVK
jgi:hypothetical protein